MPIQPIAILLLLSAAVGAGMAVLTGDTPQVRPAVTEQAKHVFSLTELPQIYAGAPVTAARLGSKGRVALGTSRGSVVIIDSRVGRVPSVFYTGAHGRGAVRSLAFSGDGLALAAGTDRGFIWVIRWFPDDTRTMWLKTNSGTPDLALNESGSLIAFNVGALRVWDTGEIRQVLDAGRASSPGELAFSGSILRVLETVSDESGAEMSDVISWEVRTGRHWSRRFPGCAPDLAGTAPYGACFFGGHVAVIDNRTAFVLTEQTFSATHRVASAVVAPGGRFVYATIEGAELLAWDRERDEFVARIPMRQQPDAPTLQQDQDGGPLLMTRSDADGNISSWLVQLQ